MSDLYPEPDAAIDSLSIGKNDDETIILSNKKGPPLEISYYTTLGWQIELRYDKQSPNGTHQPFTGAQDTCKKDMLHAREDATSISISTDASTCIIQKQTGAFQILDEGKTIVFKATQPFSSHSHPVSIYENLMSKKVTDFSERAPFTPHGELFETNMVRFQYPRPQGVIFGLPGQTGEMNRNGLGMVIDFNCTTQMIFFIHQPETLYIKVGRFFFIKIMKTMDGHVFFMIIQVAPLLILGIFMKSK